MKEQFISWLEREKPKSIRHYTSGYNTIEKILSDNKLPSINTWTLSNFESALDNIKSLENFSNLNSSGNNILTATLSNYKKFMEEKEETAQFNIPPIKPFENFKWRWAVTTPSEGINTPEILIGVLQVLLKHNGQKHATQEFQDDLLALQTKLNTRIDLAKVDRGLNKNIIENSGQYWKALGLLENSTGGIINLTPLGNSIAEGRTNYDEFIKHLYLNFKLPNIHIESNDITQEWRDKNIEILPIKLIFNILFQLKRQSKSPSDWYITPEELKDIVVPLSAYTMLPMAEYTKQIIGYRRNTKPYESWPNCTPGDNDFRMVKEYLLFLWNFGFLDFLELRDKSKRYYLNEKSINILEEYYKPDVREINVITDLTEQSEFDIKKFQDSCKNVGLVYTDKLITRFVSSLLTKPFVILTGLSGSGKTKLAQAFVEWVCQEVSQYRIIPVGADWTNREPLLGYPNALKPEEYVKPDSGVIDLILQALANPDLPHFLILDEMNLSHVERYFADFLSVIESNEEIPLYAEGTVENGVPAKLKVPSNLFIIGTVNIDETTNMFSPKVLDRANTIEFRVSKNEMKFFLENIKDINMDALMSKGATMSKAFLDMAAKKSFATVDIEEINQTLIKFFGELTKTGAEFGYRSATEILRLIHQLSEIDTGLTTNEKIDIGIMQKLLPKLHGSRRKLTPILETLGSFCVSKDLKIVKDVFEKQDFDFKTAEVLYPLSLEKITRMYKGAIDNGFASYAEA
ncbi:McrB family protein [Psychroflexus maritimus]|uniref:5-methylcytosine-specific restriction endonuclease McrBC, GTP-binding regulatory subunit McrB n=1 Tax=Psychroflexus maritimus TaxID=2714865 RepID=A0A967ACE5_9FLAO|nr:hypothetical protein [Psychroflexus maritimus]NGZ89694.1 hypothetical protein [Psychroflexus maritimus]